MVGKFSNYLSLVLHLATSSGFLLLSISFFVAQFESCIDFSNLAWRVVRTTRSLSFIVRIIVSNVSKLLSTSWCHSFLWHSCFFCNYKLQCFVAFDISFVMLVSASWSFGISLDSISSVSFWIPVSSFSMTLFNSTAWCPWWGPIQHLYNTSHKQVVDRHGKKPRVSVVNEYYSQVTLTEFSCFCHVIVIEIYPRVCWHIPRIN